MMNKETIKEFLKPDWRKIILTILVGIISLTFGIQLSGGGPSFPEVVGPPTLRIVFNPFLWLPYGLIGWDTGEMPFCYNLLGYTLRDKGTISLFLFLMVYWYFLSCLILFGWDKFRTRK